MELADLFLIALMLDIKVLSFTINTVAVKRKDVIITLDYIFLIEDTKIYKGAVLVYNMEYSRESKRIKKLWTDAKKIPSQKEEIIKRAEKATADQEQQTLKELKGGNIRS